MSYNFLVDQSTALKANYASKATPEDEAWEGSPFDWFRKMASSRKGKIGRDLVKALLQNAGFRPAKRGVKIDLNGKIIAVRTSLMWGGGDFKFEQFRDNDYDFAFCLGLYPNSAYAWIIPKNELIDNGIMQDREGLKPQHGGQAGNEDFWLTINTSDTPDWLAPYGGSIDSINKALTKLL